MQHLTFSVRSLLAAAAIALGGCAAPTLQTPAFVPEVAPQVQACPQGVPAGTRCLRGQDSAGAHYLIAVPAKWSGVLVVHAHGGPSLGTPQASRADEDLNRWAITVREGHAWAGSVFRQGGFAVTTAAQDTERVRRIFVDHVAKPRRTVLHGQSWGGMVATRAAELYPKSWDGMLLTSGVVGGPVTYDFRLDLRAIYQHLCGNHPRADEPAYPLAIGLPVDSKFTNAELVQRADDCLGLRKPAAQRTAEQARKLKTIVDVLKIPESSVASHLNWATFTLRDVVIKNGGVSPFGNERVRYAGSVDDAALNAAVIRFKADAQAVQRFAADVDHQGRFAVPVISSHGIGDATVFVEGQHTLQMRMAAAGNAANLVQTFVNSSEHSYWGDAMYPPLFNALLAWIDAGTKPTPVGVAETCKQLAAAKPSDCLFAPDYQVKPVVTRIFAR
jgi:pimeloyl-ACP methyl ester carboxylesterase